MADNAPYALAAGRRAKANHFGSFVWADATDADFATTGPHQFAVRAAVRLHVEGGADLSPAAGGFVIAGPVSGAHLAWDNNEIMARNAGSTATLYLNADGGNVAINRASASANLHVGGTIRSDGNLQAGDAIQYLTPQTRYRSMSALDMVNFTSGRLNGLKFERVGSWNDDLGSSGTILAMAPVNLPHGAVVTRFTAHLVDASPAAGWTVALMRWNPSTATAESIASLAPSGSSGAMSPTTTSVAAPLVLNDTYAYYVGLYGRGGPTDGELRYRGVVIEYTVSAPLP